MLPTTRHEEAERSAGTKTGGGRRRRRHWNRIGSISDSLERQDGRRPSGVDPRSPMPVPPRSFLQTSGRSAQDFKTQVPLRDLRSWDRGEYLRASLGRWVGRLAPQDIRSSFFANNFKYDFKSKQLKVVCKSIAGDREPESLAPQGSLEEKDRGGALGRLRWWQGPQGEVRAQRSSHHGSPPEHPAAVLDCGSGCSACSTAQRLRFLDITRCDCGCSACSTGSVAVLPAAADG